MQTRAVRLVLLIKANQKKRRKFSNLQAEDEQKRIPHGRPLPPRTASLFLGQLRVSTVQPPLFIPSSLLPAPFYALLLGLVILSSAEYRNQIPLQTSAHNIKKHYKHQYTSILLEKSSLQYKQNQVSVHKKYLKRREKSCRNK